jgi:hypothetical protein
MEVLTTAINAAVVATVGLILAWLGKGRFEAVDRRFEAQDRRMDRLEERLDGRMNGLQASLDAVRSEFKQSQDALRSDLTQIALAVGVRRGATNA